MKNFAEQNSTIGKGFCSTRMIIETTFTRVNSYWKADICQELVLIRLLHQLKFAQRQLVASKAVGYKWTVHKNKVSPFGVNVRSLLYYESHLPVNEKLVISTDTFSLIFLRHFFYSQLGWVRGIVECTNFDYDFGGLFSLHFSPWTS